MRTASKHCCPACGTQLTEMALRSGVSTWVCRACGGVLLSMAALRREASTKVFAALWGALRAESYTAARACPSCDQPLRTFALVETVSPLQLDACESCLAMWFDDGELQKVGVDVRSLPAGAARGLVELEQEFNRDEAELRGTTNRLWFFAYYLREEFRRLVYERWIS